MEQSIPGIAWLFVKAAAFTVVVPGTVVGLVPHLLADTSLAAIDVYGPSLLGAIPIVLGAALYLRCVFGFVVAGRGTPLPIDAPVQLVVSGPYCYSRNPMYVSILSILAGEALFFRDLTLLYYTSVMALGFHLIIVLYEEHVLRREFGDAYARFCEAVPRWLPDASGWEALYRATFLKAGTLVLVAGVVAHVLRLTVGLPVTETPVSIHAFLVVLPAYASMGCIVYARRIALPGLHRKVIFALATGLLFVTAVMHLYSIVADDSAWLGVFPTWYSVLAVIVYGGFAHFLKTRTFVQDEIPT